MMNKHLVLILLAVFASGCVVRDLIRLAEIAKPIPIGPTTQIGDQQ